MVPCKGERTDKGGILSGGTYGAEVIRWSWAKLAPCDDAGRDMSSGRSMLEVTEGERNGVASILCM